MDGSVWCSKLNFPSPSPSDLLQILDYNYKRFPEWQAFLRGTTHFDCSSLFLKRSEKSVAFEVNTEHGIGKLAV